MENENITALVAAIVRAEVLFECTPAIKNSSHAFIAVRGIAEDVVKVYDIAVSSPFRSPMKRWTRETVNFDIEMASFNVIITTSADAFKMLVEDTKKKSANEIILRIISGGKFAFLSFAPAHYCDGNQKGKRVAHTHKWVWGSYSAEYECLAEGGDVHWRDASRMDPSREAVAKLMKRISLIEVWHKDGYEKKDVAEKNLEERFSLAKEAITSLSVSVG